MPPEKRQNGFVHTPKKSNNRRELVYFDENNPCSLSRILPEPFVQQLQLVWNSPLGPLLKLNERDLQKELSRASKLPTTVDRRLRLQFWFEFDRALDNPWHHEMDMAYVLGRLIAKEVFYRHYLTDPYKLIYMLCVPTSYQLEVESCLLTSTEKIIEAITDGNVFAKGTKNILPQTLDKLIKVNEIMHERYMMFTHKITKPYGRGPGRPKKNIIEPDEPIEVSLSLAEKIAQKKAAIEALEKERAK